MRFTSLIIATFALETSGASLFEPKRISYDDLASPGKPSLLAEHLTNDGIVSISNIPGFGELKKDTMARLHACIVDSKILGHTYDDGTIRRTKASFTVPGEGGMQSLFKQSEESPLSIACQNFNRNLKAFRQKVHDATTVFGKQLTSEIEVDEPIMSTPDGSHSFDHIEDVVNEGLHLEHFHSYQKILPEDEQNFIRTSSNEPATIDMHTDQGFFIAFTPGMNIYLDENNEADLKKDIELSKDFFLEMSDGSRSQVKFNDEDDLVFMIGDGAKQYINPKIKNEGRNLHATAHTVSIQPHNPNLARVWYGRMVLPPQGAFSEREQMTYGDVRSLLVEGNSKPGVGCSSPNEHARLLEAGSGNIKCGDNGTFCWNRCMVHADHGVSHDICSSRSLKLQCINPRDQVWDGKSHGDYYPDCSNTTDPITELEKLRNYPRNEPTCTVGWDAFSSSADYKNEFDLTFKGTSGKFMWSTNATSGSIRAKLAFNGIFGWIAFGFPSADGSHNGMNGGQILMAVPGGNYSSRTGLDMSLNGSIATYQISHNDSAFRHWQKPINSAVYANSEIIKGDCHTALTFETDNINGKGFNITGSDDVMWAANGEDIFVGYHSGNRAKFNVEWTSGKATMISKPRRTFGGGGGGGNEKKTSDSLKLSAKVSFVVTFLLGFAIML